MIDDRTPHLDLPLPHVNNLLDTDVTRLRQAFLAIDQALDGASSSTETQFASATAKFQTIDQKFAALNALLESDDTDMDAIQELVNAIKENRDDIFALLTEREEVQTLAPGQAVVDLAELDGTSGCAVFIEGLRLNKNQWVPHPTIATRLTLNTSYSASVDITIVRRQGGA